MRTQKIDSNLSFNQRYVIVAENLFEASNYRDKITLALNLVKANNYYSDIDSVSRKMLVTTDKDTDDFFIDMKKTVKADVVKKFLTGAVEFGAKQIEQMKTALPMQTNYRVNSSKANPNILKDYFSLVGKEYKIDYLDRSKNIFFAVKDCDTYSKKYQEIEDSDISIRQQLIARKNLINAYLPQAQPFSNQNIPRMVEHIKKVLKYPKAND